MKGKIALEFQARGGKTARFYREELLFFAQPPGLRKAILSFPIIKRLVLNRSWKGLYYFAKLSTEAIAGKHVNELNRVEYSSLVHELIGFMPECAIWLSGVKIRVCLSKIRASDVMIHLAEVLIHNQYCLYKRAVTGKVIVDAGANIGLFSLYAAKLGARKVYAFEPVKETFDVLLENIAANHLGGKIIAVNMALGRKTERKIISYSFAGEGTASLLQKTGSKWQMTALTSIDVYLNGGKTDLIKIDTEGYEKEVLLGASKTIKKYKPILKFSAYHKPEDKTELPALVLRICPDYRCRLEKRAEEVFICE